MQVDGYVEGVITSENTVIISAAGRVKAHITADKVIINGLFDGEIIANTVEVLPQGKALGVIHSDDLCIERGGSFIGETQPTSQEQVISLSKPDANVTKVEQIADQKAAHITELQAENKATASSDNRITNKA